MDIQEIVSGIGASRALQDVAANAGISPNQAQSAVQGLLEHVSAGQPHDSMVETLAARVGLDPSQVQQLLPNVLGLLGDHAQNANEGVQQALGGILGGLQGSPLSGLLAGIGGGDDGSAASILGGLFGGKG